MMSSDGWRMPAEWEPQEATWLTWPSNPETWPRARTEIEEFFVGFVRLIACFQPLRIVAAHDYHPQIQKMLGNMKDVELVPVPSNDAWCRDHGPTFVLRDNGKQLGAVDWKYNAWGGKFPPWDDDDAVPERVAAMLGIERIPAPFFCEGGAIETDGEGNLLTTESVLLNDNRNGEGGRMEIETFFSGRLGVGRVVWLPDGLVGDDTDGHVDMIARFAPDNILLVASASPGNQSRRILDRNRAKLVHAFPGHTILDLPLARDCGGTGSYANHVVLNGAVLIPQYGDPGADAFAAEILAGAFPGYKVVGIDATVPLIEGGSLHCLTQNQPVTR